MSWRGKGDSLRLESIGLGRLGGRGRSSGRRTGCSLGRRETPMVSRRQDTEQTLNSPG